jgi:hypothetical protein
MATIKIHGRVYDLDAPLFGAKDIGRVRNQSERQVFHAAAEGRFNFRKDGRLIVTTPREALLPLVGEDGIARLIVPEKSATGRGDARHPAGDECKNVEAA